MDVLGDTTTVITGKSVVDNVHDVDDIQSTRGHTGGNQKRTFGSTESTTNIGSETG